MIFVSYHYYAPYESGEMHSDYGNIFLSCQEPKDEDALQNIEGLIQHDIRHRIGFEKSVVTVLNFKTIKET